MHAMDNSSQNLVESQCVIMFYYNSLMCFMTQKDPNDLQQTLVSKFQVYNFGHEFKKGEKFQAVDALISLMEYSLY